MLDFSLFENIQQAKAFLSSKKIEDTSDFDKICELLNKNPNFVYKFTKWRYLNKISMEDIESVIDVIKNNKNIVDLLDRNIIDYNKFEELVDDLTKAKYKAIINKFLTESIWYKSYRDEIKKYLNKNPEKEGIIIEFIDLDTNLQKEFLSVLKYYKSNDVDVDTFFDEITTFIEKKSLRGDDLRKKIESKKDKLKIVYDKDNVIVISTRNKSVIKELGSQKWCIVYSDFYFHHYIGDYANQQYICFNLNLPTSNYNSLFGITVQPSGNIPYGACQDMNNEYKEMEYIVKSTGIGHSIFKPLTREELAEIPAINLIKSNLISKLTKEQKDSLDLETKIKYSILSEDEIKNLEPNKKVIYGYISYLTDEDKKSLDPKLAEEYEIGLSDEEVMSMEDACGYKLRNGYFHLLTEAEIAGINSRINRSSLFKDSKDVENWYKSLNLIDKLKLTNGRREIDTDIFDYFFSKYELKPLEEIFKSKFKEDDIYDMIDGLLLDLFDYKNAIVYENEELAECLNMNYESSYHYIHGYSDIDLDDSELNYIYSYINDKNMNTIIELFKGTNLNSENFFNVVASRFFIQAVLNDKKYYDTLSCLCWDMQDVGNTEYRKFTELCPIKFNSTISLDFFDLLEYLEKNEKTEYKNLIHWTTSSVLFIDDSIDYSILDSPDPQVTKDLAEDFNAEVSRRLKNVDSEIVDITIELLNMGFSKENSEWPEEGSISLIHKNKEGKEIKICVFDITDEYIINIDIKDDSNYTNQQDLTLDELKDLLKEL